MLEVIDIEASGLGSASYPIEVGIALADGSQHSWLIRPVTEWEHWCDQAQKIHGISREQLLEEGYSVQQVCEALNDLCGARDLHTDCWVYDNSWLHLLYVTAGIRQTFSLSPIERVLDEESLNGYSTYKKYAQRLLALAPHRAGSDAKIIQTALSMLTHRPHPSSVAAFKPRRINFTQAKAGRHGTRRASSPSFNY